MKKILTLSIALIFLFSLSALVIADTTWIVDVDATGTTSLYQEVNSLNVRSHEWLNNTGSVDFDKSASVTGSGASQMVVEDKSLQATGFTTFGEKALVGGMHEGEVVPTGFIYEEIENLGALQVDKTLVSNGEWHLAESKDVEGSGLFTTIDKVVGTWTNHEDYPTTVQGIVDFNSDSSDFFDSYFHQDPEPDPNAMTISWNQAIFWANNPRGEGDPGEPITVRNLGGEKEIDAYGSYIGTDEDFSYFENFEINPDD
ncbi:MAG: hypothetical protein V5A79_06480 [Candidatus Bipolaricaulota bacterium]|nr:hypothetical protein [Candidatus Bipolaricaulota bacterium]